MTGRLARTLSLMVLAVLAASSCKKKSTAGPATAGGRGPALLTAREGFTTRLIKQESEDESPPPPPEGVFNLVRYPSPAGKLAAYVSPNPGDGKKHPIVIWLIGGFGSSISEISWEEGIPAENDQSAAAYRKAGLAMMYPSLRGGNDNPGFKEGFYGEVDDVLAAADYAAALSWVDPSRIYLGGHSTGGTLAFLTAAAAPEGRFRAVFSFGPVEEACAYGQENLPFDITNEKECRLRAPIEYMRGITSPVFVVEGADGNKESLDALQKKNRNPKITFTCPAGQDHFTVLGPTNALLAAKVLADRDSECKIDLTEKEIQASCAKAKEDNFHPAGDLRAKGAGIGAVFYYTPKPAASPAAALRKAVEAELKGVPVFDSFDKAEEPPFIVMMEEKAPLKEYSVPEETYFKYSGHGMEAADVKAVQGTELATVVVLVTPQEGIWKRVQSFNRVLHAFATETDAFIWDSPTRECFHRDAWKKLRIDGWGDAEIPDLRSQITIHSYQRDESGHLRAVTLGMEKFGLPDVAIESLVRSDSGPAANLMNIFCQTIAANPVVKDPAHFPIAIDALPDGMAKSYRELLIEKGTGKAVLAIMRGTPDEGDPENAQVALDFRHGDGSTDEERRATLLSVFWGGSDSVVSVEHDAEIKKASEAARAKLSTMKDKVRSGLEPGSALLVKGPFARDDGGNEWMWIEVLKWSDDDVLSGSLQNEPFHLKALKEGAIVSIKLEDAFDYMLNMSDGSSEGNETGKLMLKRQEEKEGK